MLAKEKTPLKVNHQGLTSSSARHSSSAPPGLPPPRVGQVELAYKEQHELERTETDKHGDLQSACEMSAESWLSEQRDKLKNYILKQNKTTLINKQNNIDF